MSRFSPTVLPTSGRAFANALGQGVNSYLQARRQKLEDDRQAQGDDLTLYTHGLREQTPDDLHAVPNAGAVNQHLAASLNPAVGLDAPAQPTGYRPEDAPVHLGQRTFVMTDQAKRSAEQNQMLEALKLLGMRTDMDVKKSTITKNNAQAAKDSRPPEPRAPLPGTPEWRQMKIDEAKISAEYGYHPPVQPSYTPVTVQSSADAPPEIKPFNTKTGTVGPTIGGAKQATRIESATNTAAKARLEAAVSEMNNAHKGMEEYETALRNGTANINGLQQFASRVANSFTHDDPVSMTIQSTALATLNRTNPELARYIRRALSFAEGESMISQRPSDFRTKMSAFLSAAASGASSEMIHDIEQRRTAILDPLNRTVQPGPTKASAPSSGNVDLGAPPSSQSSRAQQLWDAAVAKHGRQAVEAKYGPRPEE